MSYDLNEELSGTAYWRGEVALRHPGDARNEEAKALCEALASQKVSTPINKRIDSAWEAIAAYAEDSPNLGTEVTDALSDKLRGIGFNWSPSTIDAVGEAVIDILSGIVTSYQSRQADMSESTNSLH